MILDVPQILFILTKCKKLAAEPSEDFIPSRTGTKLDLHNLFSCFVDKNP